MIAFTRWLVVTAIVMGIFAAQRRLRMLKLFVLRLPSLGLRASCSAGSRHTPRLKPMRSELEAALSSSSDQELRFDVDWPATTTKARDPAQTGRTNRRRGAAVCGYDAHPWVRATMQLLHIIGYVMADCVDRR